MGLFDQVAARLFSHQRANLQFSAKSNPQPDSTQLTSPQPGSVPAPMPSSVTELELQIQRESQRLASPLSCPDRTTPLRQAFKHVVCTVTLLSVPIGVIAVINLPYPPIRRPIAEKAPLLLLPSYISLDYQFRQAISSIEAALLAVRLLLKRLIVI
jgi:hypothetical protein